MILAIRIENILSKNQILELYLNDIYLGYGSYGVASASLNYFNKSLNELTLLESAFLAALPKAPNNYNPKTQYLKAFERRNWVLKQMYKNKYINKEELSSKENKIVISERYEDKFQEADYYKEETRQQLNNLLGSQLLYEEGLIVKTSIDTNLQKTIDEVLKNGLISHDKKSGWRGPIANISDSIHLKLILDEIKNPFPNSWKILQIFNFSIKY